MIKAWYAFIAGRGLKLFSILKLFNAVKVFDATQTFVIEARGLRGRSEPQNETKNDQKLCSGAECQTGNGDVSKHNDANINLPLMKQPKIDLKENGNTKIGDIKKTNENSSMDDEKAMIDIIDQTRISKHVSVATSARLFEHLSERLSDSFSQVSCAIAGLILWIVGMSMAYWCRESFPNNNRCESGHPVILRNKGTVFAGLGGIVACCCIPIDSKHIFPDGKSAPVDLLIRMVPSGACLMGTLMMTMKESSAFYLVGGRGWHLERWLADPQNDRQRFLAVWHNKLESLRQGMAACFFNIACQCFCFCGGCNFVTNIVQEEFLKWAIVWLFGFVVTVYEFYVFYTDGEYESRWPLARIICPTIACLCSCIFYVGIWYYHVQNHQGLPSTE